MIQRLLGQIKATPYLEMLIEIGTWPVESRIDYHRLMFYRNLIISGEERDARRIMIEMMDKCIENGWCGKIKKQGKSTF